MTNTINEKVQKTRSYAREHNTQAEATIKTSGRAYYKHYGDGGIVRNFKGEPHIMAGKCSRELRWVTYDIPLSNEGVMSGLWDIATVSLLGYQYKVEVDTELVHIYFPIGVSTGFTLILPYSDVEVV